MGYSYYLQERKDGNVHETHHDERDALESRLKKKVNYFRGLRGMIFSG